MIKRTLYFGNPAYLSLKDFQLVIKSPSIEETRTASIEDIGFVILDSPQITLSNALLSALMENNCAVMTCGKTHLPEGLFLPLSGNVLQSERFQAQIEASIPLKKQLWQQTIRQKILNQAGVLILKCGVPAKNMLAWANDVKSGDTKIKKQLPQPTIGKKYFQK